MNIKHITISMAAVAVLFTACGGGGGGTIDDGTTPAESAVSIQNSVKSFKAVAGEDKYVSMSTGKFLILNEAPFNPLNLFRVVSVDSGATAEFDEVDDSSGNNYGILTFSAATPGNYNVVVNVKNSVGTSADTTFSFEVVAESIADSTTRVAVLGVGRSNFTRGETTDYHVKDNDTGLSWFDSESTDLTSRTYSTAKEKCKLPWRLPTLHEVLDIVDYSNPNNDPMLPDSFTKKFEYIWAEDNNGQNLYVNLNGTYGVSSIDTSGEPLPYRCVKGDKYNTSHLIATNPGTGATYDYTTGLMWSKADSVVGLSGAAEYCNGRINENTGWRLPTINELRSITENGLMPSKIVFRDGRLHTPLISSTDMNVSMNYSLGLDWKMSEAMVTRSFSQVDSPNPNYSATCVKEF